MKKKLEIQTIIVLLCVLGVAGSWIGIQISKDSLGVWSESSELEFRSDNLLGLGPRSELHCAGAVVGHVRRITPSLDAEGRPSFILVAGIKNDYTSWTFAPVGTVKAGVVQSALAPPSIALTLDSSASAVRAVPRDQGKPPVLALEKEQSNNELAAVAAQYRQLGDQIDHAIRQFVEPQNGRSKSVMQELAEAVPSMAESLRNFETITLSLETQVSPNGTIDRSLQSLNTNLVQMQDLTAQVTKTVGHVDTQLDTSMRKVNTLLAETTGTMTALRGKVEGFGDTLVGRMLIAKPDAPPAPSPAPKKKP